MQTAQLETERLELEHPERPEEPGSDRRGVAIPSFAELGRRAVPQAIEGAIVPAVIFLLANQLAGLSIAIVAALGWSGVAIGRRAFFGRRVPAMLVVGAVTLLGPSILGLVTGSAFVYFFQPSIGPGCLAVAFLVSVVLDRPLARRFAGDFCVLPGHLLADLRVHRFFRRVSVMWAIVGFANSALALGLLMSQSTSTYVVTKTALSIAVTVGAVGVSAVWFRQSMLRHGLLAEAVR